MSKQYFNCSYVSKHYFYNPDFKQPCCCPEKSLKKMLQVILNSGLVNTSSFLTLPLFGSTSSGFGGDISVSRISIDGNLVLIDYDDGTPVDYPQYIIPLCNIGLILFNLIDNSPSSITYFSSLLANAFPITDGNCGNKTCCCTNDLTRLFKYYLNIYGSLFFTFQTFFTSDIFGKIVAGDCQSAIIEVWDNDEPRSTGTYTILPLCNIGIAESTIFPES